MSLWSRLFLLRWHLVSLVCVVSAVIALIVLPSTQTPKTTWVNDCVKRHTRDTVATPEIERQCEYAGGVFFTNLRNKGPSS